MARATILLTLTVATIVSLHASRPSFRNGKSSSLGKFLLPFKSNFALPFGPFYLSPLITTSTVTTTHLVPTIYTRTIDAYCLEGGLATCPERRRRETLKGEEQVVYIDGQPFQPSQVSGMLRTEMPVKLFGNSLDSSLLFHHEEDATVLTASMRSPVADEGILKRSSRRARINGEWFFATTTTVTLTAVTVVNSTNSEFMRISIVGCIPKCLTTLPHC